MTSSESETMELLNSFIKDEIYYCPDSHNLFVDAERLTQTTTVLVLVGFDSNYLNRAKFEESAKELLTVLGFNAWSPKFAFCLDAHQARASLRSFFCVNSVRKLVLYVGHGIGGRGSFAFDFAADLIDMADLRSSTKPYDLVKQPFLFMHEFITLATEQNTTKSVKLYNCSCCALASADVINLWQRQHDHKWRGVPLHNIPQFSVYFTGCELKQLIDLNNGCEYTNVSICQGIQHIVNIYKYAMQRMNFIPMLGRYVNLSYHIPARVLQSLVVSNDTALKIDRCVPNLVGYWENTVVAGGSMVCIEWNNMAIIWQDSSVYSDNSSSEQIELHGHERLVSNPEKFDNLPAQCAQLTVLHVKSSRNGIFIWPRDTSLISDKYAATLDQLCDSAMQHSPHRSLVWKLTEKIVTSSTTQDGKKKKSKTKKY